VKRAHLFITLFFFTLAACSSQATPTLYIPPTRESTQDISSQLAITTDPVSGTGTPSPQPSPSPACIPGLAFLEDITIPDGTSVNMGEILDKRWLVENNGSCNWDHRFTLRLIAGPDMAAQPEYALFPARSGTQAEIRILFTAPQEPGAHRSAWQAHDPGGNLFGDPVYIEVVVGNP
jgi:hypothetical protein